ncbi:protein kinase [Streptomyces sp. NPDC057854]|uniref:WD40 repeat domain-containing serine/threonine protein kinase n=1 Tax=unclassified Streptomyces TaxID=2593676 RepID=UPI0036B1E84B
MTGSPLGPEDPERVGGYWLAARLGAGAQGVVYEAYDAAGARLALKLLRRDAGPFVRDRFAKEAEAARRVAPFCTARVLDASVQGDVPYLVSEYVPGPTLAEAVRTGGPLDPDATWRLATGAATALSAIHAAGVVHRDLKPGNVLLGPDGPRIIDFGIARTPDMSLTATGALMGTFGYMAPEVLGGRRATPASDVFAWGAVVLYAATGTEPFRGANVAEATYRTAAVDPDLSPVDARLRPLVAAALAKDPARRPHSQDLLLRLVRAAAPGTRGGSALDDEAAAGTDLLRAGARQADHSLLPASTFTVAPLGERAEDAYAALPPPAREAAFELLLRTVVPGDAGDGSQDGVRTASRAELFDGRPAAERSAMTTAVDDLAAAGILVVDADGGVRPVSAALVPAWSRLRGWADGHRASRVHLQHLARATGRWLAHGGRDEDLLAGSDLRTLLDWLATAPDGLRPNPAELRHLTRARTVAARAVRRRRQLLAGLAVVTVLALLGGAVAYLQNREADARQAEADRRRAEAQARTVAQTAQSLRETEPGTAMLLGLAAYRIAPVPEALGALYGSLTQRTVETVTLPRGNGGMLSGRTLTPSGTGLVVYGPDRTTLTDLAGPRPAAPTARRAARVLPGTYSWTEGAPPAVSPDGRLFLRRTDARRVQVVDGATGRHRGAPFAVTTDEAAGAVLSLTNRGQVVERRTDDTTVLWDAGGRIVAPVRGTVSPTGRVLACDARGTDVLRTPGTTATTRLDGFERGRCRGDTVFSPDGSRVARLHRGPGGTGPGGQSQGNLYTTVALWNTATGGAAAFVRLSDVQDGIQAGRFSSHGRYFLGVTTSGDIGIWDSGTGTHLTTVTALTKEGDDTSQVEFALHEPTKSLLVMTPADDQLRRVDVSLLTSAAAVPAAPDGTDDDPTRAHTVTAAASADGGTAVVREGYTRMRQRIVDLRTGRTVRTVPQRWRDLPTRHVANALDHDGDVLAFTDFDDRERQFVVVWDTRRNAEIHRFEPADDTVRRLTLSPDGRHLSAYVVHGGLADGDDGLVQVWDVRARKELRRFADVTAYGRFSPDNRTFALTSGQILDLATGRVRTAGWGGSVRALAFSPDGRHLALTRATGTVELWDGAARQRVAQLPGGRPRPFTGTVDSADEPVFSHDGTLLASVTDGNRVQLWDVGARTALGQPLETGGRPVDVLAFGQDRTLRVLAGAHALPLRLGAEPAAAAVCARAGRDITPEEWRTYVLGTPYRTLC